MATTESNLSVALGKKLYADSGNWTPFPSENWSVRDTYVVEIKPKDPRYPQSKKVVFIDKEGLWTLYGIAYDRAGKLWKVFQLTARKATLPDGDSQMYIAGSVALDLQFGMGTTFCNDFVKLYGNKITYTDVLPSALTKRVR